MRFFSTLVVGASALASFAAAQTQPFFTWQVPAAVKVGETYNVTYSAASPDSPVTIILRKGASNDLSTVGTLTSSATGGSYLWTPAKDLAEGADYALQIKQGSSDNYSKQFTISGGTAASSSASSTASTTSSASASASSNATTTLTTTHSGNSTVSTTGTPSASRTGSSSSATGSSAGATGSRTSSAAGGAPTTGAGNNLKSPMALVFGAVAAMVYLH